MQKYNTYKSYRKVLISPKQYLRLRTKEKWKPYLENVSVIPPKIGRKGDFGKILITVPYHWIKW